MNITYDSSGVEISNACFQQETYDFSEVKTTGNKLNILLFRDNSNGIELIISTLIPAESPIACQRQGYVIIDS